MPLMERFANPDTIGGLSMGDKLMGATITMVIGMGITFLVLFMLWFLIAVMGRIMRAGQNRKQNAAGAAAPVTVSGDAVTAVETEDPDELIAVITAAIAAAEADSAGMPRLVVRNIRRTGGSQSSWARVGIEDCVQSRKM